MTAMDITHFRYEIFAERSRTAIPAPGADDIIIGRVMEVSVVVDGETITHRQAIMDTMLPFETEIEFYTRRAVGALHELLRQREKS